MSIQLQREFLIILWDKIKNFNDEIFQTFSKNKQMNSYCGIILPFGQKTKKIIVHIFEKYSFFLRQKKEFELN